MRRQGGLRQALWMLGLSCLCGVAAAATEHLQATGDPASAKIDEPTALKLSQAAIGRTLDPSYRFTTSEGNTLTLGELRGKPLVISLIYTSCYHVCPTITQTLERNVRVAREALGEKSFSVVTIGFDTKVDSPERMRVYARERGIRMNDWHFLSTDAATMKALARELGFTYFASPKGFDHVSQATIVDGEGKVYRPVYGESFPAPTLVEPLKDLVLGRKASTKNWDGWINGIKLFCTVYDPSSGRYKFDYSLFIGIGTGLLSFGVFAVFLARAWRAGGGGPQRPA